jgi:hypothetical protein
LTRTLWNNYVRNCGEYEVFRAVFCVILEITVDW